MMNRPLAALRWACVAAAALSVSATRANAQLAPGDLVPLSMGSGHGYATFSTEPYGGFNGRYCAAGAVAFADGIVYTPNSTSPAVTTDDVNCLTRMILMVAGDPTQTQDLFIGYLSAYQSAGNVTLTSDTHDALSRTTTFTVANLHLDITLVQTVVSPAKLEQVFTLTSAQDETLRLIDSMDADLNWEGGSGANYVLPLPGVTSGMVVSDAAGDIPMKLTASNSGTFEGYRTQPRYNDAAFVSPTQTGWALSDLNNRPVFGDAHTQLQFSIDLQARVPFVHTVSYELPGPIAAPCVSVINEPGLDEHGLVLFEDKWPQNGDLDFNDQVVAYNYAFLGNGDGTVNSMQVNIDVLAVGATLHNGLYLHLPLAPDAAASIVLTDTSAGSLRELASVAGEPEMVLELSPDTALLFASAHDFQNTETSVAAQASHPLQLRLMFASPIALDTGAIPYDLFIARTGDFGHQIHLMTYGGTHGMNTSLFGTDDDRSPTNPSGHHFVNENGLPFALNLFAPIGWPTEQTALDLAYPLISDWAASGGTLNPTWYASPVAAKIFALGAGLAAPAPVMVRPELSASCE